MNPMKGIKKVCGTCDRANAETNLCDADGRFVGYVEFFEQKCEKWKLHRDYKKGGKFYCCGAKMEVEEESK